MPKFVIERSIPGAGHLSDDQLKGISQKSCAVLKSMGPQVQRVESFVRMTRCTACISRQMRKWYASMHVSENSRLIQFRRCGECLTPLLPNRQAR